MQKQGVFICIEGLDKSGKTSQSILLVEALNKQKFDAIYTTEPSNGEIGKFIRRNILHRKERVPAVVEALLFAADRIDHNEREIRPMLKDGKIVISDRYIYSSLAYQGAAGLDINWIRGINKSAVKPDIAIYLDVPIDIVAQRCKRKRSVMERPDIQEKVRDVYLRFVREGELIPVNGNRRIGEVAKEIRTLVLKKLQG